MNDPQRFIFRKLFRRPSAFSLVEVTLAIGIASFCLISLLSLFTVGLESGRQSENDTFLAEVATRLFNDRLASATPAYPDSGQVTVDGEIAATGGIYTYELSLTPLTADEIAPASSDLSLLKITFRWPVGAASDHQQTQVYISALLEPASAPTP